MDITLNEKEKRAIAESFFSAFEEPDKNIPEKDLEELEKIFVDGKAMLGGTVELPNGRKYKCLAIGWKRID